MVELHRASDLKALSPAKIRNSFAVDANLAKELISRVDQLISAGELVPTSNGGVAVHKFDHPENSYVEYAVPSFHDSMEGDVDSQLSIVRYRVTKDQDQIQFDHEADMAKLDCDGGAGEDGKVFSKQGLSYLSSSIPCNIIRDIIGDECWNLEQTGGVTITLTFACDRRSVTEGRNNSTQDQLPKSLSVDCNLPNQFGVLSRFSITPPKGRPIDPERQVNKGDLPYFQREFRELLAGISSLI